MYIYNFNFIYNRLFNYTCTENIYNIKSIYKNPKYIYICIFSGNHFIVTVEIFSINNFLVHKTNILSKFCAMI